MSVDTMIALVKRKAGALVTDDSFRAAIGDEGTGPTFNTVTIDDVEFMQGQFWSGPAQDPDNPNQGPVPANVNNAVGGVLTKAIQASLYSRLTVANDGSQSLSGPTTLSGTQGRVDADLFSWSGTVCTLDSDASAVGDYEVDFSVMADSAGVDAQVEVWLESGASEVPGTRRAMNMPGATVVGMDRDSAGCSITLLDLPVSTQIRVRAQATVGSATIEKFTLEIRRAG